MINCIYISHVKAKRILSGSHMVSTPETKENKVIIYQESFYDAS